MAEETLYEEPVIVEGEGDPDPQDPLGLRKKLSQKKTEDPLGLRKELSQPAITRGVTIPTSQFFKEIQGQQQPVESTAIAQGQFTPEQLALKPPKETLAQKYVREVERAQKKLVETVKGNKDVKEKMIRQRRFENVAGTIEPPKSESPLTQSSIDLQRYTPQETKPQDLPVTPEDFEQEDIDINVDEGKARRLVQEVGRLKPDQKQELEKSVYLLDATRSMEDTPKGIERSQKILKNAKGLQDGKLTYDVRSGRLYRPEGFTASLISGWKQKSQLFDDYSFFNNASDEQIISNLEKRRTEFDPDDPIPVPKNKLSEVSQMLGGTPVKPLIAGGLMTFAGAPEAAPFAAGLVGGADFYQMGYAGEMITTYNQLRNEGISERESFEKARELAKKSAIADAAMGVATGFIGARMGTRPLPRANFGQGYRGAVLTVLKKSGTQLKKATLEGLVGGGIGAAGQVYKNSLAQDAGIDRPLDEGVLEQIEGNLLMTVGIAAAAKLGRGLSPKNYKLLLSGLAKVDGELLEAKLNEEVQSGQLTEQQAMKVREEVKAHSELDAQIPTGVAEDARIEIQEKLKKRAELEGQLETQNKAFHPDIKEKIKKLDEDINELAKQKEPQEKPTKDQKEIINLIDDAIDEGLISDALEPIAKSNPEGFMKMIADQAFGRTEEGGMADPNAEYAAREQFGDSIVDKAKELYPLTIKSEADAAIESGISEQPVVGAINEQKGAEEMAAEPPIETIPPTASKVYAERPETELSHRGLQNVANEFSLPDVEKRTKKTDVELRKEAENRSASWIEKGTYFENIESLTKKAEEGDVLTDTERVIMEQHLANITEKARSIPDKNSTEYKALYEEIKRLKLAGQKTRSEAGAALRLPTFRSRPTDSLEDALMAKEEANNQPLTPEQTEQVSQQINKIENAKKSLTAKGKEIADKIRALRPKTDSAQSQFFGLPIAVYDTALVAIAEAVEKGAKLADAIQAGIEYVKKNGGFPSKLEEKNFVAFMKGASTEEQRLAAFKKRTKAAIDKLKKKTEERDFEKDPKTILELDEEARELKKEYRDAKYEFELELQKDKLRNRPFWQKATDAMLEPLRAIRTILTSFDFSAPLRQGIVATTAHPVLASKAFPEMFKQAFSKGKFDEWLADLKESPAYDVMEKSGLYVADPNNLHLTAKEENFMSNLAERIPVVGALVKGSERAYVGYLNKLRTDLFKQGMEVFMGEGKTPQNSPELYEGLASFINNSTGRGKLGPLEGSAQFLNTVFFSPRLMASRMNTLGLTDAFTLGQSGYYSQLPKEVRMMAIKDMLKFIGFGTAVLGLAKMGGAEVENDPRSSDFGKIKSGDTRWDIWGGFQPFVRVLTQLATGQSKTGETVKELKGKDKLGKAASFFRGKLAPVPSSLLDIYVGENIVGEPATVGSEALESITPMLYRDVQEAMKEQGIKAIFTVGVPAAFGVGTNTYESKKSKTTGGRGGRGSSGRTKRESR